MECHRQTKEAAECRQRQKQSQNENNKTKRKDTEWKRAKWNIEHTNASSSESSWLQKIHGRYVPDDDDNDDDDRRRHTARNSTHKINVLVNVYARDSAKNALQSFVDCLLGSPLYFSCFWFFAFFAFRIFIFLKNDFSRSSRHIAQIITTSASAFTSAFYNERTKAQLQNPAMRQNMKCE